VIGTSERCKQFWYMENETRVKMAAMVECSTNRSHDLRSRSLVSSSSSIHPSCYIHVSIAHPSPFRTAQPHRTKLHPSVAVLVLLQCLKTCFSTARGSSGHQLFVSAFTLVSEFICDGTYSNKLWSIVDQGMFQLRETNQRCISTSNGSPTLTRRS
jgi:hypothetical protein